MRIGRLGELVLAGMVLFYFIKLLTSRYDLYDAISKEEYQKYNEARATYDKCSEDHVYKDNARATCAMAELDSGRWWRWSSARRVFAATESCIEYPCTELIRGLYESWASLALAAILLAVVMFSCFLRIFTRIEQARPSFGGNAYYPQHNPALMHYGPPTVVVDHNYNGMQAQYAHQEGQSRPTVLSYATSGIAGLLGSVNRGNDERVKKLI